MEKDLETDPQKDQGEITALSSHYVIASPAFLVILLLIGCMCILFVAVLFQLDIKIVQSGSLMIIDHRLAVAARSLTKLSQQTFVSATTSMGLDRFFEPCSRTW